MPTLAQAIGFIIASFVIALFVGRFVKAGAGKEVSPPNADEANRLADRLEQIMSDQASAEVEWIADLQQRNEDKLKELANMDMFKTTPEIVKVRLRIRMEIAGNEDVIEYLRKRADPARRVSMATWTEGRM